MSLKLSSFVEKDPPWLTTPFADSFFRNLPAIILVLFLFLLYGFFLSHKIDLTTADLGRHIKNGEIFFSDRSILTSNIYSYTYPDEVFINHHWASGVLFFVLWKLFGFVGLEIFFIFISFATLAVFLLAGRRYAGWGIVGLIALVVMPLLWERTELRPEIISYFFAGLFFLILRRFRDSGEALNKSSLLWSLPFFEILWVNLHVYFFLGPLILGAFLLESLFVRRSDFKRLFVVFITTISAIVINPQGVKVFTATINIFENYGYRLAENQPVWFIEKIITNPNFFIFKIIFTCLFISFIFSFKRKKGENFRLADFFVASGMSVMAWFAIRNLSLFGFFAIPLIAGNLRNAFSSGDQENNIFTKIVSAVVVGAFFASIVFMLPRYFPYWREFGFGLESGNSASADFILRNKISGPIFNNYDIGGYLIFYLFPKERVFVDNRPEAYPPYFFKEVYIPMQESKDKWEAGLAHYRFNTIVFSHNDLTPWGQKFLIDRSKDPLWAPVFVDRRVIIFLRRSSENSDLISRFEIDI